MNKLIIRVGGIVLASAVVIGLITIPVRSTNNSASEDKLAGADILLDQYAAGVASGSAVAATETPAPMPTAVPVSANIATKAPVSTKAPRATKAPAQHVALNLNYSRLGIASKVETYLNVRKKPTEDSKVVGKLIKNAGCHVYKIKDGWAKIVSGKVNGWVKASYMVFDKKAEELAKKVGKDVAVINTPALKVRQLPTTKAHIYSVVAEEEEFEIRKEKLTKSFVEKIIKVEKISERRVKKAGGIDSICENLNDWICIKVDNEYAFVAKDYITKQYTLKRAVKIGDLKVDKSSGVSSRQVNIVEFAKRYLGNRYVWGGTSLTNGTDCSGFTQSVYRNFGYSIPRTAAAQCAALPGVKSPIPGDLFFYSNGYRVNHVAMYIGSGMVIHASNPSDGIKISNAYYRSPIKIGRVMH